MIDNALPIPRSMNAGNENVRNVLNLTNVDLKNVYLYKSILFQGPSISLPTQIAPTLWCP